MDKEYPFGKLEHYPHMKPVDIHLWNKFLSAQPKFGDRVDYDVLVGEGTVVGDVEQDEYVRDFQILTQKKIDAVVYKGGAVFVFEIKPFAGAHALGQVETYTTLLKHKRPDILQIRKAIITNKAQSDFAIVFEAYGIMLFEVGICSLCDGIRHG